MPNRFNIRAVKDWAEVYPDVPEAHEHVVKAHVVVYDYRAGGYYYWEQISSAVVLFGNVEAARDAYHAIAAYIGGEVDSGAPKFGQRSRLVELTQMNAGQLLWQEGRVVAYISIAKAAVPPSSDQLLPLGRLVESRMMEGQ